MFPFRIPMFGPAPAASGRGRTGLALRLRLAFASIAVLTVLGGLGTLLLFGRVETVVGRMATEQAPAALNMLDIEGLVGRLAAQAPTIAAARDDQSLAEGRRALERTVGQLRARLAEVPEAVRAELVSAGDRLETVLRQLADQRERLNGKLASLRDDVEELARRHQETLKAISAPVDDLAFDLVLGIESLSETSADPTLLEGEIRSLVDGKWEPIQALFALRAETNGVSGLLAQAAMVDDASMLQPLLERFEAARDAAHAALAELPEELRAGIAAPLEALLAFGEGERNLFDQRREVLDNDRRLATLARNAADVSRTVEQTVEDRVRIARAELASGAEGIARLLARGRWLLVAAVLLVLVVSAVVGWYYVQRCVVHRLGLLHEATLAVAQGRRDVDIPTEGEDELAAMARALALFRDKSAEVERLEAERRELAEAAEEEKRKARQDLARRLETQIGAIADQFANAAAALSAAARDLASEEGDGASSGKIDVVARTCRELEQAAREIAEQMDRARAIGDAATTDSERSTNAVEELDGAIAEIEEVVTLISDIAEQTNLLALNATIEAARAGEAGKGFAVVAGEVKALATQTASATGKITQRIAAIRRNSGDTVEAITTMAGTVRELADVAGAVAAALEQQGAATAAILENVEVAIGSAREMQKAADGVAADAERLRGEVRSFVEKIGAA